MKIKATIAATINFEILFHIFSYLIVSFIRLSLHLPA